MKLASRPGALALCALVFGGVLAAQAQTQAVTTLTLAEAPVRIVRGSAVYKATPGTIVQKDDLIETSDGAAQVETGSGAMIALGPQTRMHVASVGADAKAGIELQVLQGWVKFASGGPARASIITPELQLSLGSGAVIVNSKAGKDALFADEGEQLVARTDEKFKTDAPTKLPSEKFAFALEDQALVVQARPTREFLGEMPPAFRDRLGAVPASARGAKHAALKDREVTFADVAPWLASTLPVRKTFVARFRARVKDPEFRKQLEQAVGKDSEWKNVLYRAVPKPTTNDLF